MPISKRLNKELQYGYEGEHTDTYNVLKEEAYLDDYETDFSGRISRQDVEMSLRRLSQIVFEMTTACNLRCEYCCYGDGYITYEKRKSGSLRFETARAVLDYFSGIFDKGMSTGAEAEPFAISFYGGEPLLKFPVLRDIVEYSKTLPLKGRRRTFTMTTNAMLLRKHAKFLEDNDFSLLVSLDGNRRHDAYRKTQGGKESFEIVYENLQYVKRNHPKLFAHIRFNTVYTDLCDAKEIIDFFRSEFGKYPQFSPLRMTGVATGDKERVMSMRKPLVIPMEEGMLPELIMEDPMHKKVFALCVRLSENVFHDEGDMLTAQKGNRYPTGTCIPFGKRMYVTFEGEFHPCEKVNRDEPWGKVDETGAVVFDIPYIVERFNKVLDKHAGICSKCYLQQCCTKCALQFPEFKCCEFVSEEKFREIMVQTYSYIEDNPSIVDMLRHNVVIK